MMYRKNISVIMATFNGAKYIKKQLDSILSQTLLPHEVIICDDGSTDGTVAIINEYKNNNKIRLNVNQQQLGVVGNFKAAATIARPGNWVLFADQDDIWVPNKLERLAQQMELIDGDNTPALIYSDLQIIDGSDAVIAPSFWKKQRIKPQKIKLNTLLYGNVVTGCTTMVNYAMIQEFLTMPSGYLHDEWLALIAYSFGKARYMNEQLVLYRQHESNVTFSATYEQSAAKDDLKTNMDYLLNKKAFLYHEFELAEAFLLHYKDKLTLKQVKIIEKFIKQKDKNYLLQRINRRIAFL